ncbi:MAG: hypothetical protein SNJ77_10040, partial [Cytophagales bacterium]
MYNLRLGFFDVSMIGFDFWKSWSFPSRIVFFGLLSLWLSAFLLGVYFFYVGFEAAYPWSAKSVVDEVKVSVEQIDFGFLKMPLDAKMFYLNEQWVKILPDFETLPHYLFAVLLVFCLALLMACFSFLRGWW